MRHRGRGLQRVRVRVGLRVRDRGRGRVRDKARIRVKVRVRVRRRFSFTVVTKEDSLCPESRSGLGRDTLWLRWLSPLALGCSRRRVAARLALRSVPPTCVENTAHQGSARTDPVQFAEPVRPEQDWPAPEDARAGQAWGSA